MKNHEEKAGLCALGKIFGFKPKTALALLKSIGSGSAVFRLEDDELDILLGPYSRYRAQITPKALEQAYEELSLLEDQGIYYIGWGEDHYPPLLRECEDAPVGLYIRSDTPPEQLWRPERKIAIVGTRDISPYGKEWCEKTVAGIASGGNDAMIISGLALGTDICAHKTALEMGLPTIGVMATGPELIYPWRNRHVAEMMARTPGCALVTDFPPGTAPLAPHFLRRNRIIAGLSEAVVLMESKIRGGGMVTSRIAFSYSREVYALPGRVDDIRSQGCNRLIYEKIAEPLVSTETFLSSLGMKKGNGRRMGDRERLSLLYGNSVHKEKIADMAAILETLRSHRGISIEEAAARTGLPYIRTANICNLLESDGIISIDLLMRCSINTKND